MWRDIAETLTGCAYWWIIRWSLYPRSVLALHVLTIGCEILQVRAGGHQAESPMILRAESVVRSECFRGVFPEMRRIGESAVEIVNDGPIVRRVDQNNVIILRKAMSCYWKNSHSTLEMCFFFLCIYIYKRSFAYPDYQLVLVLSGSLAPQRHASAWIADKGNVTMLQFRRMSRCYVLTELPNVFLTVQKKIIIIQR